MIIVLPLLRRGWQRLPRAVRLGVAAVLSVVIVLLALRFSPYPALSSFMHHDISTVILDRDGRVVQITSVNTQGLRREYVPLAQMPPFVADIFIEAEDKKFRHHIGVDITAILRAAYLNLRHRRVVSGGSTITMQLARLIRPAAHRNIIAKVREALDALRIEARLDKDEILELYLNNVPFGHNAEGVASAARTFFALPLERITREQCLTLSVIPRRPASYDVKSCYTYPFNMPHYIRYLRTEAGQAMLGTSDDGEPLAIGHTPVITLAASLRLQNIAQRLLFDAVTSHIHGRITQGAALVCDTQSGEVLAWVGSADWQNERAAGQVDEVLAMERPGSAMKPFLYALALDGEYSPSSVLPDVPFEAGGAEVYVPQNFNNRYSGPVRLRIALASSLNVPAVYILRDMGMERYMQKLNELHFTSLDERGNLGLSLALGGAEVRLLEAVRAFSVFPRDGVYIPLMARSGGKTAGERVYSIDTARLICDILSDASARAMGFGYAKTLTTPFPSMFKTGTANQYTSIVALAATPLYTVGVWMGNFDGDTVQGITGSAVPASVAKSLLMTLQGGEAAERQPSFALPEAWHNERICALSGMSATALCPDVVTEYVSDITGAPAPCSWHTASGVHYPSQYAEYLTLKHYKTTEVTEVTDEGHLTILSPQDGCVFYYDDTLPPSKQTVTMRAVGMTKDATSIFVTMDDAAVQFNIEGTMITANVPLQRGKHTIKVQCAKDVRTLQWEVR